MISLLILEVNKCLIFSLDSYVFVLNFFLKIFIDFTTIILRLSFEIILKLTNVSYFLCWICCFWGTMSFCSHFHVFSLDFIFVEIWNNTCSKKKISEYSKLLRRRRKKIAKSPSARIQFSSVAQSCPSLCDPTNHSKPGLSVHHQLPEFIETHVHRVSDDIQPSHPLSSPFPPAPNPSWHQGLFQCVNPSHEVAKILEFQLQHQSFQWTPRTYLL